jgi:hypothetical protein
MFRLAKMVQTTLEKEIKGEGQSRDAVSKDAVVNVSAGGVIAGKGRRLFPCFTTAASNSVVTVSESLLPRDPEALEKEQRQQYGGDALGQIEMEAANARKSMGHQSRTDPFSLNADVALPRFN